MANMEAAERRISAVKGIPLFEVTDSAIEIASALMTRGIVPKKAAQDALHIAVALYTAWTVCSLGIANTLPTLTFKDRLHTIWNQWVGYCPSCVPLKNC